MVKTAVLMATYNGEKFVKEQLESIKNQELKPDYVFIRDDQSTDSTVEIVKSFIEENSLSNWIIEKNKKNLGWRLNFRALLFDVLNYEVDYVFFSDQDDTWYLDKNRKQVDIMENNKEIDVLSADIDIIKISEEATVPNQYKFKDDSQKISQYPNNINYVNYRQGWTFCIRKSFLDQITPKWTEDRILSHDNLFAGISGFLGTGYNLNEAVGVHKRHGGNASGNLLNLKQPYSRHVSELLIVLSYYQILYDVAQERNSDKSGLVKNYLNFYLQRYNNAKDRRFSGTIRQLLFSRKYYVDFSNWARDIVFLFKK
ncbi:glycosyl transferase family 2 [Floricoccus tropicus]|uniref:Glycosyl transferase family 2 n=1 Tax=Floricoccus tropicus TaxID=1859473 RepID=A0A1E8GKG7_9LACT|nr:glycosyltransferase [Floricoccus tropicus]OFI48729.1 glycosyl transferase family 2 [Floricoccus tropicus]